MTDHWTTRWQLRLLCFRDLLRNLPLFQKILIANTVLVALGIVLGYWITSEFYREASAWLVVLVGAGSIAVSVLINSVILRAALSSIEPLRQTVERVQRGDRSARVQRPFFGDPDLGRLGETLNALLDMVDRQQHELEEQLKQVQALSSAVIRAQEEERRRIALELHDEASQALTAIIVGHRVLDQLEDIEEVRRHSQRLRELTAATLDDLHRLIVELRPSLLEERGLGPAVRWHANEFSERFNIPVEVMIEGLRGRLPAEVETVLFRIVQEALTNVARHAQARNARVRIERTARGLDATIEDDGRGFSVERVHAKKEALPGLGLVGMHERAASLNGWCTVTSTVGQGTRVCVHIPEECLVAPEHGNGQDQHIEEYSRGEDTYSHR